MEAEVSSEMAYCKGIKVKNDAKSAKMVTKVQTSRDCALHQWNVR